MKTRREACPEYDTDITFCTPPVNQGQIVTVSYAAAYPYVICCVHDASDGTTTYSAAKMLTDDDGDYWHGAPSNKRWRKMTAQELRNFRLS